MVGVVFVVLSLLLLLPLLFVTPASPSPRGFLYAGHDMVIAVVEVRPGIRSQWSG